MIENKHNECFHPKKIKLRISGETIRCGKVRRFLRHHIPNKILPPEKFTHHVLHLFHPPEMKKNLLSGFPLLYQNSKEYRMLETHKKINFIPSVDLTYQTYSKFIKTLIDNQDPHSQIGNDESPERKYTNEK